MQNVKELLDEVFNSQKYSYATIFTYGGLQHRCAVGTTIYSPRDGYCLLSKTIEKTIDVFGVLGFIVKSLIISYSLGFLSLMKSNSIN